MTYSTHNTVHSIREEISPRPQLLGYHGLVEAIEYRGNQPCYQLNIAPEAVGVEGLLVSPEVGDSVLCIEVENQWYISQVIKRAQPQETLLIESSRPIEWLAPKLRFNAMEDLELASGQRLSLSARDLICGASRSLVQQAKTLLQQVGQYSLTTKGLMRLQGRQQLITAEEDIRMDAKRINMG